MNERPNRLRSDELRAKEENQLCIDCGMCCDGTLFSSVRIVHADRSTDLPDGFSIGKQDGHFDQPCPALTQTGCSIYTKRPKVCRAFNCGLLQRLQKNKITYSQAQEIKGRIQLLRDKALKDLRYLFESTDGFHALSIQFHELHASLNNKDSFEKAWGTLSQDVDNLNEQLKNNFTPEN